MQGARYALAVRIGAAALVVLTAGTPGAPARDALYAGAGENPDVVFARGETETILPFDDVAGLVFVRVSVERSRPLEFVLDSGAAHMVYRRVADELGLRRVGSGRIGGAGTGGVRVDYVRDVTLALAGITSHGHELAAADLRPLEATVGRRVDGVLGYELFARLVVEIDYPAGHVTLRAPERYTYRGSGVELPLDVQRRWPFVRGEIVLDDGSV